MTDIATVDMFVVTTVTSKPLAAVSMFSHHRKRVIHFDVTGTRRKSGLRGKSPRPFLGTLHPHTARRPQTGPTAARRIQTVARSAQQQARSDGFSPPCQPACMDSHGFSLIRRISASARWSCGISSNALTRRELTLAREWVPSRRLAILERVSSEDLSALMRKQPIEAAATNLVYSTPSSKRT
jgi:hypothetical protein